MNKKAISPLTSTIILVVFALVIGTITMNWGKSYVEKLEDKPENLGMITINLEYVDTPLKQLQINYITDKITLDDYLRKERELLEDGIV